MSPALSPFRASTRSLLLPLCIASLLPLAGCNNSAYESAFRVSFRSSFIDSCVTSAQASSGNKSGDFGPVCTCVADKMLAMSTSSSELTANANSQEKTTAAIRECRAAPGTAPIKP